MKYVDEKLFNESGFDIHELDFDVSAFHNEKSDRANAELDKIVKQLDKITVGKHDFPIKDVYKTFKEINQLELVNQAGIRQQYIDQAVSLNLAFPSQAEPKFINKVHLEAWKKGIKTLYYIR